MNIINPKTIEEIGEAQEIIGSLQARLFDVEMKLDDLARSAEIATITNQFHLLNSFIESANACLQDRLEVPEEEPQDLKLNVIVNEDVPAKST